MKKNLYQMMFFYCCSFMLTLGSTAFSQIIHLPNDNQCRRHSGDMAACLRNNDCDYDFRTGECSRHGQGGGGGRYECRDYDYDRAGCQSQPQCRYVPQTSRCVERSTTPERCSAYDSRPNLCEITEGCRYDHRYQQCLPDHGGGGGGQIETVNIRCESRDYRYEECYVDGDVLGVSLVRQESSSACRLNSSFGISRNGIWVDDGCRGLFRVRYRY